MVRVIKRDGREVPFEKDKIKQAIMLAFADTKKANVKPAVQQQAATSIAERLYDRYRKRNRAAFVEEIQDDVETALMNAGYYTVARSYIKYRYDHELARRGNTTDGKILSLVDGVNETVIQENSNKNPAILSTQRDYIAGEVSRDIANRLILTPEITQAHEEGIIHVHDTDYIVQREFNCCLVNLEDMLQNGTIINNTLIEKPHSFATACNIATQIIAQVSSNQYGGQTISLAHLAPFVDVSRKKIAADLQEEHAICGIEVSDDKFNQIVERRVKDEIKKGVQTIQYQINTLMTVNGQAPFVSVFMYLNEVEDGQTKDDLALIIEEVLRQRIQGVKNEVGAWVTPAFPKLLYVLEPDNMEDDQKYFYLSVLAAECTAKRMVPDYISEKIMLETKIDENGNGNVYGAMGCRSFLTPYVDPETNKGKYWGRLTIR